MERVNIYMTAVSDLPELRSPKEYREFAEKITGDLKYKLIRFDATFRVRQFFGDRKTYRYSESKKIFFDSIPLQEFEKIGFSGAFEKKNSISNFELDFNFNLDSKVLYTTLVFENDIGTNTVLINYADYFGGMMNDISNIDFL